MLFAGFVYKQKNDFLEEVLYHFNKTICDCDLDESNNNTIVHGGLAVYSKLCRHLHLLQLH
jgi:hypothetical protein